MAMLWKKGNFRGETLTTNNEEISLGELQAAVDHLKNNQAAVQVPAKIPKPTWRATVWMSKLMQVCWMTESNPTQLHLSQLIPVRLLKGSSEICNNYDFFH